MDLQEVRLRLATRTHHDFRYSMSVIDHPGRRQRLKPLVPVGMPGQDEIGTRSVQPLPGLRGEAVQRMMIVSLVDEKNRGWCIKPRMQGLLLASRSAFSQLSCALPPRSPPSVSRCSKPQCARCRCRRSSHIPGGCVRSVPK